MAPLLHAVWNRRTRRTCVAVCLALCGLAGPATSALADCRMEGTQLQMTKCASERYQAADADLNAAWQRLGQMNTTKQVSDLILDAQRAWLTYRDATCTAEGAVYEGGSIQPMVRLLCLERLTKRRTDDLLAYTNSNN